jgi:hypothetical protein
MKQDRFLTGILIGIGVLILLALTLFLTRQDKKQYLVENSPYAATYNYVLAVTNKDYKTAYSYLADKDNKPTYDQFRQSFFNGNVNTNNVGVNVGKAEEDGSDAFVDLTMVYSSSDPFPAAITIPTAPGLSNKMVIGSSSICPTTSGLMTGIQSMLRRLNRS